MKLGGIVLCGGQSVRMGTPKAWLPFGSEPMLVRIVRILQEATAPIVAVAAVGQELPELPPDVLRADDDQPGLGPLQGLATGLAALPQDCDAAFVSSCDVPLLRADFVRKLAGMLGGHDMVVPMTDGYRHPLAAIYRRSMLHKARALLAADRRRLIYLFEDHDVRLVPAEELREVDPQLDSLRNLNTPAEYETALRNNASVLGSSSDPQPY